jgi:hypothetical protein
LPEESALLFGFVENQQLNINREDHNSGADPPELWFKNKPSQLATDSSGGSAQRIVSLAADLPGGAEGGDKILQLSRTAS